MRPSTTYVQARSGTFNAAGDPVTFTLNLGRNTRCFIQHTADSAPGVSPSGVINVRTVLSLSAFRTGVRTYVLQGRNLSPGRLSVLPRFLRRSHSFGVVDRPGGSTCNMRALPMVGPTGGAEARWLALSRWEWARTALTGVVATTGNLMDGHPALARGEVGDPLGFVVLAVDLPGGPP